jgi:hypothetical protein
MRHAYLLLALSLAAACGGTSGGECSRYIKAQNACSNELGNDSVLSPLSADLVCATFNLPGLASKDLRDEFACLADAYESADCSSEEAFSESIDTSTCGEDVDSDATEETDA